MSDPALYKDHSSSRSLLQGGGLLLGFAVLAGALVWLVCGRYALEKTLTALAMPCGVIWLGLIGALFVSVRMRQRVIGVMLAGIVVAYTFFGSSFIGRCLVSLLERDFYQAQLLDGDPHDLVVVLGGGVEYLRTGESQLRSAGDRVVLAARMYHRGKAKHLAATGAGLTPTGVDPVGGAKAAAQIWRDLGVPDEAITLIPGYNTSEEAVGIREMMSGRSAERVGLLTSAWHLPRAMRLARRQRLEVVPVPADFRTASPTDWRSLPEKLMPSAGGFQMTSIAMKEFLAGLVGR